VTVTPPFAPDPHEMDPLSQATRTYYWKPMAAFFRARELVAYRSAAVAVDGRMLDLGCGEGGMTDMLRSLKYVRGNSHGVDIAFGGLIAAKRRNAFASISQADANKLPFRDECFSSVICNGVLCAIPEGVEGALGEINRVLESGGKIVATVPTDQFIDVLFLPKVLALFSDGLAKWYVQKVNNRMPHFHVFSVAEWEMKFLENGFDVIATRSFMSTKEGHFWNLLSMYIFRIFGLLRLLDSKWIKRVVSGVLAHIFRRIASEQASEDAEFGYLLIMAVKRTKV
jgi:ubiquinone/menaquinone biosynthesis C-methylase UbiE